MMSVCSLYFNSIFVASVFATLLLVPPVNADNGNLISDGVFGNENAMTEAQIQNFINAFPQSCLIPSNYPSGLSPVTFQEPLSYFDYGAQVSPARIIYKAATMYHLNPQVILATLEKEQNLVTGNAGCAVWKYNSAVGYNCPDGSENALKDYPNIQIYRTCVAKEMNAGFSRQINHATWQFRFDKERAYGNLSWGGDQNVYYYGRMTEGYRARVQGGAEAYYDGYTVIDGQSFKIQNGATAALYNFTPHFNNFQSIFRNWFGSTSTTHVPGCAIATNTSLSCIYKTQNSGAGETITTSYEVANDLVNRLGYSYLGISYTVRNAVAPQAGNIPIYSMTKPDGSTFITANINEYNAVGFTKNGVAFYADPANQNTGYPVYRMYNPTTSQHAWTTDRSSYETNGFQFEEVAFTSLSNVAQSVAPGAGKDLVYRFRDMPENRHFWTSDIYERDRMIVEGYKYDGVGWTSSQSQTNVPIYRLYSPTMRKHLYTADENEKNVLSGTSSWRYEGIAFYAGANNASPVYRLYRSQNAAHLYTTDANERNTLVNSGSFRSEGNAWLQP